MRAGCKQTEVGIIPDDWRDALLDRIAKRGSGHTPDKKHPEYWDGNIRWISLADSAALDQGFIEDTNSTITPEGIAHSSAVLHPAGTVVLSRDAGVGKSAIMRTEMAVSQHFMAWQCGPELHNLFLYYWLQSAKPRFERIANGTTIKTIGLPYFKDLKIPHPPLAEQCAIAAALSDVDALLDGLDRLIAKRRDLKQAAMQQLLTGQTRLPGFHGVWEVKTLGEVATIRDGTHQTPRYVESGIPFYSVEHVTSGDFTNTKFISEAEHRFLTRSFKIQKGDILMTRIGSIGDCKLIDWGVEASFYVSLALLKIRQGYSAAFISHYSKSARFQKEVELHSLQSAIPKKINLGPISNVRIEFPSQPEQCAIAAVLSAMDAELSALEARRDKTRNLKKAMVQELLTGKTRLVPIGDVDV